MASLTKKEKTQQAVINAAISLFASLGYNATATSLIAKEAKLSEATIFKYYKTKENLLKSICLIAIERIVENISIFPLLKNIEKSKEYPLKEFIHSVINERLDFLYKNHEMIKLLLIEMQYSENLKNQAKASVYPRAIEICEYIKVIIAEKAGITKERADAVMRIILGVIGSVLFQKYLLNFTAVNTEINREVDEVLSIIEKGCK